MSRPYHEIAMTYTPYPDVNAMLELLLSSVRAVLGERFVGLYLYGSLSSGDFDPQTSDIDFVVVTDGEIPSELLPELEAMHQQINASGSKWALKLEGSYLPVQALRRYNPNDPPRPTLHEGDFYLAPHGVDWVLQRHILRETGLIIAGTPLQPLIDRVEPDDIRRAVRDLLHEWWLPMLDNPTRLQSSEYQAYAVLTMCRVLYALEHGAIASKRASAKWAQTALDARWASLIEGASAWRVGSTWSNFDETVGFIRFTLERAG